MDALQKLVVVLVRTRNPLNIGAVARAMQNFGVRDLRLVEPFAASFREAQSAVGAADLLHTAREYASLAEATADCRLVVGTTAARRRVLEQELIGLELAAAPIHRALREGRAALIFGSEKHGLTRSDMKHCHWLLRVPTEPAQPSMNLGQAAAVCLWELARLPLTEAPKGAEFNQTERRAAAADLERLGALGMELLEAGGYTRPRTSEATAAEIRVLLRRLHVTDADTHLLMGMVRKLLRAIRTGASRGERGKRPGP